MPPRQRRGGQTAYPPTSGQASSCGNVLQGMERRPKIPPHPNMKSDLIELIRTELRSRLDRLARAAMAAHAAATDPGSKAESKYDTRSLEESYLATGQARQVTELAETLRAFENLKLRDVFREGRNRGRRARRSETGWIRGSTRIPFGPCIRRIGNCFRGA